MITSPRTNGVDNFVPSHPLALITQPVLGARSRSRKKTTNIIVETPTSTKDKFDSMTNSRRSSYNDSPPLILPINRVDTSQYQKKTNSNSHHESSDSGLDLSLSTNSSVQLQQYPQQHISIHRPLSALNEDSSPDDGYHDEHQQTPPNGVRLRFPPVNFGRNRSMEDMISNNTREQQHRSSSFSDEQQQKLYVQQQQKIKRSSDGAILDLLDQTTESYRRTNTIKNELLYPPTNQQHRSLNDLNNKTSNRVLPIRNESNTSTTINNLPITQTIIRKANTSTLKPLRKKTKLNIIVEPSIPLTSSRLAVYDEQINAMTGTTSSSSNQTTPRSIRPLLQQQQIKPKATTPLGYYPNQEQMRIHVNRSVIERQHPPTLPVPSRRGVMQQMIPFDASPSKVNNLLLRHHIQQNQPTIIFYPSSNVHISSTRQIKQQTLPTLYNEETISNVQEEKRKQIKIEKIKEQEEKKHLKHKEEFENNKSNEIHQKEQGKIKELISQRHFINSIQKQQEKQLLFDKNLKKKIENNRLPEDDENIFNNHTGENYSNDNRQRRLFINDSNRNSTNDRYGSSQSTSTVTSKPQDSYNINQRQQKNAGYPADDSLHTNRSDEINGKQRIHKSKPTGLVLKNKTQNNINDNNHNQPTEPNNQYGSDYSHSTQKNTLFNLQTRPSKIHFQTITTRQTDQNRQLNQWENSKYGNNQHSWQKSQPTSISKTTQIQSKLSINTNIYDLRREREISQLSNISKTDSIKSDEKQFKQKIIEKNSTGYFQSKSPTSWSVISEHQIDQQPLEIYEKTNTYHSELPTSPSSHNEFIGDNTNTPSRTYRLMINDQQQPLDGKYVISSNNLQVSSVIDPSSHTSSRHTYPFTYIPEPDFENNDDIMIDNSSKSIQNKKQKSVVSDVYTLSDRESTQNTIDQKNVPSPLVHLSSNKKFYSPTPPEKVIISTEKDEIESNYDSDDGWSDDSAELLYVDERYAKEKRKVTPSSHLPSQQHYHYQIQQQNVLLQ